MKQQTIYINKNILEHFKNILVMKYKSKHFQENMRMFYNDLLSGNFYNEFKMKRLNVKGKKIKVNIYFRENFLYFKEFITKKYNSLKFQENFRLLIQDVIFEKE